MPTHRNRKGKTIITNREHQQHRLGGVDSHKDTIHVAVITESGQPVGDREFPTTVSGYRRAVAWLIEHGPLVAVGVEGTSSYGVGITTELLAAGLSVVEVNRTRPAEKRKQGKTDPLDAYRAARCVLSGEASTDPKSPTIEPLRALTVARRSAVKAQQATRRQIGALLVNTSPALRDRYRDLPEAKLLAVLHDCRPEQMQDPDAADTMFALRTLARRHRALQGEIDDLEQRMLARATRANPALMAIKGVGPAVGAQLLVTAGDNPDRLRSSASFAALCGTAPIPVSSGKTSRHRLCRGGDRQANAALHHIVKVRMSYDPATRDYRDTRLDKGWTKREVFRALKRAVAREIFHALAGHATAPDYSDLRPARRAKNLTLTAAAEHLGVWPARIGELELGRRPNEELATRYRAWLNAA
ncbi:IS110 family transposase [Intrasporangium calvum]|uniref:IS110 family transposase n=1 Tax=Intrasporangium calvum TaxID=53358 RepID=A0ABT5GNZ2_9MICO|nr:IS110 family transposase [Intrasporangium calvum]MDC5699376.1 IS110 family transposase [Intrasporangium calvum]